MKRRRPCPAAVLAVLSVLAGCGREEAPWFREAARERGLDWSHVRARTQRYWFPEIMGGGVGLLDSDGDGTLDVFLVQSGDLAEPAPEDSDRLFRNLGGARFKDVSSTAVAAGAGYGMGCAAGDADQDGDPDVYVTRVGPNALLVNEDGVLREFEAGVGDANWGTSAAWLDHDRDGDLDLFVVNYVRWAREREITCTALQGGRDYCSPLNYDAPTRDVLYRNEGDGRFADVSEAAGLGAAFGNGLGVSAADFDLDGRIDVFVANDLMPNQLWLNRGDGSFAERALLSGCAVNRDGRAEAGMGVAVFDAEDDGDPDLYITHLRDETNTFYRNQGGLFSDQTGLVGLGSTSQTFTGFGVGAQDFDRDGHLDLYVANGAVTLSRAVHDPAAPYAEPNQLFLGRVEAGGKARFVEHLPRGGTRSTLLGNSRGAAFGDLDEDGDEDVVVVDNGGPVELLLNEAPAGHWIGLRLLGPGGADALGARAAIECDGRTRYRWVASDGSYCSSSDPRILCGLGAAGGPVLVTVLWPDGSEERFGPLAIDRKHELRRGRGLAR